jgi:hypothetical protein
VVERKGPEFDPEENQYCGEDFTSSSVLRPENRELEKD